MHFRTVPRTWRLLLLVATVGRLCWHQGTTPCLVLGGVHPPRNAGTKHQLSLDAGKGYGVLRQLLQLQEDFLSLPRTKDFVLDRGWPDSSSVDVDEFLRKQKDWNEVIAVYEFAAGHIPGATNLPLTLARNAVRLDDDERLFWGPGCPMRTTQTHHDLALDSVHPKLADLLRQADAHTAGLEEARRHVLLYCKRGGLRSQSMAKLLSRHGFDALVLRGGYKAFRGWAERVLREKPQKVCVIAGATGSGKTEVLAELGRQKLGQVIDLEALERGKHHRAPSSMVEMLLSVWGLGSVPAAMAARADSNKSSEKKVTISKKALNWVLPEDPWAGKSRRRDVGGLDHRYCKDNEASDHTLSERRSAEIADQVASAVSEQILEVLQGTMRQATASALQQVCTATARVCRLLDRLEHVMPPGDQQFSWEPLPQRTTTSRPKSKKASVTIHTVHAIDGTGVAKLATFAAHPGVSLPVPMVSLPAKKRPVNQGTVDSKISWESVARSVRGDEPVAKTSGRRAMSALSLQGYAPQASEEDMLKRDLPAIHSVMKPSSSQYTAGLNIMRPGSALFYVG
eukprot:s1297_g24.t2